MNQTTTEIIGGLVAQHSNMESVIETTASPDWLFGDYSEESSGDYYDDIFGGKSEDAYDYSEGSSSGNSDPLPILFKESIDLLPFNITKLSFQPQPWNAQDAFTDKVLGRLYLVVPGAIVGILLGVTLWAMITLVLRSLNEMKKKVFPRNESKLEAGVELGPVERTQVVLPEILPESPKGKMRSERTITDVESETTSSGIGKSEFDLPKSESSFSVDSSREGSMS